MARKAGAMRMYMPIWLALKEHKIVTVTVPARLHARIIKAVIKEKWLDRAFNEREGWRKLWLHYHISGNEITFSLKYRLNDLVAKDL